MKRVMRDNFVHPSRDNDTFDTQLNEIQRENREFLFRNRKPWPFDPTNQEPENINSTVQQVRSPVMSCCLLLDMSATATT